MMRNRRIDVSPSSSIEYLRHKEKYSIIPWLSVSSIGPVRSIFLFSKLPLKSLDKKTIAVSMESETSTVLLKIILREFYSLKCRFVTANTRSFKKVLSNFSACLLIGDQAMREAKRIRAQSTESSSQTNPPSPPFSKGGMGGFLYIYDLGELWFKHTGLPFVFALWMVKRSTLSKKGELVRKFASDLIKAKEYAPKKTSFIARHAPQRKWLSEKELVNYWKGISYDFTEKHMEGLRLFEEYAIKMNMLN